MTSHVSWDMIEVVRQDIDFFIVATRKFVSKSILYILSIHVNKNPRKINKYDSKFR